MQLVVRMVWQALVLKLQLVLNWARLMTLHQVHYPHCTLMLHPCPCLHAGHHLW